MHARPPDVVVLCVQILRYVESRMNVIAPNTCALVGSGIASQLLGLAGGLTALSRIPGCNIAVRRVGGRRWLGYV